jgi:NAD(P)-dependent dehydrogenase (short-subunit alcohol dehydrogenase family)
MPTAQAPLPSGFSAASTAAEVIRGIDLGGKVAIVTGGYSGLGRETVRSLLGAGARVVVPARDTARAQAALAEVAGAEVWPMDLLDPAAIDAFARRFLDTGLPLHILVNNAGIMALPERELDARGHECQFATNHLGHFQLSRRLWPALARAQGARVVSVSSMGHRFSPVVFDDIDFERRPYDPWAAYGQSKTANILFAVALDRRGQDEGVRAFSLHPGGIVGTGLDRHVSTDLLKAAGVIDEQGKPILDPAKDLKTVAQGAATQVWCATSPQLDGMGGVFCADSDIAPVLPDDVDFSVAGNHSANRVSGVKAYAIDPGAAERLWTLSERMTGLDAH